MKQYYIYNEGYGYLCKVKGKFTSEDGHVRRRFIFWSEFEEGSRYRHFKLFGMFHLAIIKILTNDLYPKLIEVKDLEAKG